MQLECENCHRGMLQGLTNWHFTCDGCGLEASTLSPGDLAEADAVVDEADREAGLEGLRRKGFEETIRILQTKKPTGTLLDVGCAHGWFLEAGTAAGFACTGIEPSTRVAQRAVERGQRVLAGYFPSALAGKSGFDIVSYNDVFEHIPHARQVMTSSADILAAGGVLSIAIPSSRGFFYRTSKQLTKLGLGGPFERMWQKSFSSPHLYYFHADVITKLAQDAGLKEIYRGTLPSVRVSGLWDRLTYDTRASKARSAVIYVAVLASMPFLRLLPADIDLLMYQKAA